jgi:hypothetical protein
MKGEEATSGRLAPWHDGGRVARGEDGLAGWADVTQSNQK